MEARVPPTWLTAGRIGRPHGLDGSFHVTGARVDLLVPHGHVRVGGAEREIVRRAGTARQPILKLDGCADRDAAEALRGADLLVALEAAPVLEPGEYYPEQLRGCRVRDGSHPVGTVAEVLSLPSCEALEVALEGKETLVVPMVSDAIRTIDLDAGEIDIDRGFLGAA